MPARQGFQYSPEAQRENIGYGAAQVVDNGVGKMIDADAKRRQLELAEAAERRKSKPEKLKAPLIKDYKLIPRYQKVSEKLTSDFYNWYSTEGAGVSDAVRKQKETELRNNLQAMAGASEAWKGKVGKYDEAKKDKGYERLFAMGEEDVFNQAWDKDGNFNLDLLTDAKTITDAMQYDFIDINETVTDLKGVAEWNADKSKIERFNKDKGVWETIESEEVGPDLAKDILDQKFKSLSTDPIFMMNLNDEIEGANISDKEKQNYLNNPRDWYSREENVEQLTKSFFGKSIQEAKEDDGSGKKETPDQRLRTVKAIQEGDRGAYSLLKGGKYSGGSIVGVNYIVDEETNEPVLELKLDRGGGKEYERVNLPLQDANAINNIINSVPDTQRIDERELEQSVVPEDVEEIDWDKLNPKIEKIQSSAAGKGQTIDGTKKALEELFVGAEVEVKDVGGVFGRSGIGKGDQYEAKIKIGGITYTIDDAGSSEAYGQIRDIVSKIPEIRDANLKEKKKPSDDKAAKIVKNPTSEQYEALKPGDKYIYNGTEYTKE
jgi:hypothetical protein